ncbi:MAG: EAL domain-containing protein [Coriobacteriales bacterium]|nr:EAL domain-containing protein [Coriobacteriales bacterium]
MGIRARTIIAVAVVITLLAVAMNAVLGKFVYDVFREQEASEVKSTLSRAEQAIALRTRTIAATSADWAKWDDTYRFAQTGDRSYSEVNLIPASLDTLGLDYLVIFNKGGQPVGAVARDGLPVGAGGVPLVLESLVSRYPSILDAERERSGVVTVPEGSQFLSARPIVRSDGSGPARGTLVMGRLIDPAEVAAIGKLAGHPVRLFAGDVPARPESQLVARNELAHGAEDVVTPVSMDSVSGYTLVKGLDGGTAFMLGVTQPRTSLIVARRSLAPLVLAVLSGIAGLIIALGMTLDRVVLQRLKRLSSDVKHVAQTGDLEARVNAPGADEVTALATDINSMLEALQVSENELAYLAGHDPLTRLCNRRRFEEELGRELAEQRRLDGSFAILWLDIDTFTEIHDSLGHTVGDDLLSWFADTLHSKTRSYGTLARIGGDEFAVIVPHAREQEAMATAQRLARSVQTTPYEIDGHLVQLSVSVGVVLYPVHGEVADDLLACADLAMYHAKESGGGRVDLYSGDWQQELATRVRWGERIRDALEHDRFVFYAQPIVRASDAATDSFELLLRMIDEHGHVIMPGEFIPVAEQLGLIRDIDRWVAVHAIELLAREQESGRDVSYSINISGRGFTDPELPALIVKGLVTNRVQPWRLIIEITETAAVTDIAKAQQFIGLLRDSGCRFAIDDFGSGAASFFYLKHLHVDFLKIDGTIVQGLRNTKNDGYFVRAIVEMCRGLRIDTIAEYVEDAVLFDAVCECGVDCVQGYYTGRPQELDPQHGAETRAQPAASPAGCTALARRRQAALRPEIA